MQYQGALKKQELFREKMIESTEDSDNDEIPCFLIEQTISDFVNIKLLDLQQFEFDEISMLIGWEQGKDLANLVNNQSQIKKQNKNVSKNINQMIPKRG